MSERTLVTFDLLLRALDGDRSVEAEARSRLESEPEPALRVSLRGALAHTLAEHRRDEARELLKSAAEEFAGITSRRAPPQRCTEEYFRRVARQNGPASALAESLLVETGAAYR